MDNNAVERTLREPVVGRKNYAGSRALWSGQLLVQMLSLLATLKLWESEPTAVVDRVSASVCAGRRMRPCRALSLAALEPVPTNSSGLGPRADATGFDVAGQSPPTRKVPNSDEGTKGLLLRSRPGGETRADVDINSNTTCSPKS